jgi:hypothetical protein
MSRSNARPGLTLGVIGVAAFRPRQRRPGAGLS